MKRYELSEISGLSRRCKFRFKTQEEFEMDFGDLDNVPDGWTESMNELFGQEFSLPSYSFPFRLAFNGSIFTINEQMVISKSKNVRRIKYKPKPKENILCEHDVWRKNFGMILKPYFKKIVQHESRSYMIQNDTWFSYSDFLIESYNFFNAENYNIKNVPYIIGEYVDLCYDWANECLAHTATKNNFIERSKEYDKTKPTDIIIFTTKKISLERKSLIAIYFVERNILFSCDLGHYRNSVEHELVTNIRKTLESEGVPLQKEEKVKVEYEQVDITLGADPEFEVFNNEGIMNASGHHYLGNLHSPTSSQTPLGLDGAGTVAELRPAPADSPYELVYNLSTIMKEAEQHSINFTTKGDTHATGGHIHAGFSSGENNFPDKNLEYLLSVLLLNPVKCLNGKARGSYASRTPFESKPYGFEYRLLPAAIFENPVMAYLTLKIFKGIVDDYFSGKTITISQRNSYKNYKNWISEKEYKDWNTMIKTLRSHERPIMNCVGFWIDNPEIINPTAPKNVSYSSDIFFSEVREHLSREFNQYNQKIVFFGLSRDRGNVVFNIEVEGYKSIDYNVRDSNSLYIGLPYDIRRPEYLENDSQPVPQNFIDAIHAKLESLGIEKVILDKEFGKQFFMNESLTAFEVL